MLLAGLIAPQIGGFLRSEKAASAATSPAAALPPARDGSAELLVSIAALLATTSDPAAATRIISDEGARLLPFTDLTIALKLTAGERVVLLQRGERRSLPELPLVPVSGTTLGRVLRGEVPNGFAQARGESRLIVPLRVAGTVHGSLVFSARAPAQLTESHVGPGAAVGRYRRGAPRAAAAYRHAAAPLRPREERNPVGPAPPWRLERRTHPHDEVPPLVQRVGLVPAQEAGVCLVEHVPQLEIDSPGSGIRPAGYPLLRPGANSVYPSGAKSSGSSRVCLANSTHRPARGTELSIQPSLAALDPGAVGGPERRDKRERSIQGRVLAPGVVGGAAQVKEGRRMIVERGLEAGQLGRCPGSCRRSEARTRDRSRLTDRGR